MANIEHDRAAKTYSAQEVRQGDIILKKPWQRAVFIAGLVGAILFALAMSVVTGLMH